jgi:hypothetical protein
MAGLLRDARNAAGWRHPIVGLHARRGDACHAGTGRRCLGAAEYLAGLRAMRARYGVSRVWVASDDDGTLAELRAADPSFQFLQLAGSRLPPRPPHFPQVHRRSRGVRTFRRSMGFRTLGALPCTLLHPQ